MGTETPRTTFRAAGATDTEHPCTVPADGTTTEACRIISAASGTAAGATTEDSSPPLGTLCAAAGGPGNNADDGAAGEACLKTLGAYCCTNGAAGGDTTEACRTASGTLCTATDGPPWPLGGNGHGAKNPGPAAPGEAPPGLAMSGGSAPKAPTPGENLGDILPMPPAALGDVSKTRGTVDKFPFTAPPSRGDILPSTGQFPFTAPANRGDILPSSGTFPLTAPANLGDTLPLIRADLGDVSKPRGALGQELSLASRALGEVLSATPGMLRGAPVKGNEPREADGASGDLGEREPTGACITDDIPTE